MGSARNQMVHTMYTTRETRNAQTYARLVAGIKRRTLADAIGRLVDARELDAAQILRGMYHDGDGDGDTVKDGPE